MARKKPEYWTAEELERARVKGAEIAAYLQANAAPCLPGCLCRLCGGDPAKQAPDEARAGTSA